MKRAIGILVAAGLILGSGAAWALTSLCPVTPKNLAEAKFTLSTKAGPSKSVEFVIRRDIRGIDGPGRAGYLSDRTKDPKSLGTRLKLDDDGKTLTFRFTVPEDKVATSEFTLWGQGLAGEGVTFEFKLREFWKK
jgi:hypothetical protein